MTGYATVNEMIEKFKWLSENNCGDYIATCNDEYALCRKDESAIIDNKSKTVDFGGYNVL